MYVSSNAGEEPLNRWGEFVWAFRSELIHLIEKSGIIPPWGESELKAMLQCAGCLSWVLHNKEKQICSAIIISSETLYRVVLLFL